MICIICIILSILIIILLWNMSSIKRWYSQKYKLYSWIMKHKNELPIDSTVVINAGDWMEVEENSIAQKDGIYLFICKGDNHLLYESHTILRGTELSFFFQDNKTSACTFPERTDVGALC